MVRGRLQHLFIDIQVGVQADCVPVVAMVDSGATGQFMDEAEAQLLGIDLLAKEFPEDVYAVDGRKLVSGPICQGTGGVHVWFGDWHEEVIDFSIIRAPQYGIILGLPWLRKHNPSIN